MHMNALLQTLLANMRVEKPEEEGEGLLPRQKAMYEMYETIAEKFGKWDGGTGANGAHYVANSPFKGAGMVCSNCSFFLGGKGCEIVEGNIEPDAICKLWIIKEGLIKEETK